MNDCVIEKGGVTPIEAKYMSRGEIGVFVAGGRAGELCIKTDIGVVICLRDGFEGYENCNVRVLKPGEKISITVSE